MYVLWPKRVFDEFHKKKEATLHSLRDLLPLHHIHVLHCDRTENVLISQHSTRSRMKCRRSWSHLDPFNMMNLSLCDARRTHQPARIFFSLSLPVDQMAKPIGWLLIFFNGISLVLVPAHIAHTYTTNPTNICLLNTFHSSARVPYE